MAVQRTPLYTYQDAIDYLIARYQISRASHQYRQALFAVENVYRDFPNAHEWTYYDRRGQVTTVAPQSGTLAYDHTGGTYERECTIDSGTLPTTPDTEFYRVLINNTSYEIDSQKSSTVFTLTPRSNPGADIATGTSYTLYRSVYTLPINYRKGFALFDLAQGERLKYVSPAELLAMQQGNQQPQDVTCYTIRNAGEYYGGFSIEFGPPPSTADTYDYVYRAAPRQIKSWPGQDPAEYYSTGTVTVTGGSTTATLSTAGPDDPVGSVIRFSADGTTAPTGTSGSLIGSTHTMNPYTAQRIVVTKTSSTVYELDATPSSSTLTDVKFSLSDPLDLEAGAMLTAFWRALEAEYEGLRQWDSADATLARSIRALQLAAAADHRDESAGAGGGAGTWIDQLGYKTLGEIALVDSYGGTVIT